MLLTRAFLRTTASLHRLNRLIISNLLFLSEGGFLPGLLVVSQYIARRGPQRPVLWWTPRATFRASLDNRWRSYSTSNVLGRDGRRSRLSRWSSSESDNDDPPTLSNPTANFALPWRRQASRNLTSLEQYLVLVVDGQRVRTHIAIGTSLTFICRCSSASTSTSSVHREGFGRLSLSFSWPATIRAGPPGMCG